MKNAFWDILVSEVAGKKTASHQKNIQKKKTVKILRKRSHIPPQNHHPIIYLTPRETECVIGLLRGYNMRQIAKNLRLSSRTIEFYLNNVKVKLRCRTKKQIIQSVTQAFINAMPEKNSNLRKQKAIKTKDIRNKSYKH